MSKVIRGSWYTVPRNLAFGEALFDLLIDRWICFNILKV